MLMHEARQGVLTYNTLWDTHLNQHGCKVVSEEIARRFRQR
ncbi:MAG: hypothetical protein O3A00_29105 [Planctomycetota bacterium]|nr:hypothetical protein [Planctomycetota bacterium]